MNAFRSAGDQTTLAPSTQARTDAAPGLALPPAWGMTLLFHPELERIGARAVFPSTPGSHLFLSRLEPPFVDPWTGVERPPGLPFLSRSPLKLVCRPEGIRIEQHSPQVRFAVNDIPGEPEVTLNIGQLEQGVRLTLGQHLELLLHPASHRTLSPLDPELPSVSTAMEGLRSDLALLAPLPHPVLILGETGVGKELVARALHRTGPRGRRPLHAVNMAALPASTAAAELFGFARGAFTGAAEGKPGLFREAAGSSLFLDEVGETPLEVQPLLLRALELREIQPLGQPPQAVDVRILAATDADLEALVAQGRFKRPLLFRLSTTQLRIPPLRRRLADIPFLFVRFLRQALGELGQEACLTRGQTDGSGWLRRTDILSLLEHPWPGNVRELKQVALQVALHSASRARAVLPESILRRSSLHGEGGKTSVQPALPPSASSPQPDASPSAHTRLSGPDQLTEALLLSTLEAHEWRVLAAARALGVSRNFLYGRMLELGLRSAAHLSVEQILEARSRLSEPALGVLAESLRVSPRALQLRMKSLGLDWR